MSTQDEVAWRAALELKGRDWAVRELRTRPGVPNDILLDVVYTEPHPTREFVQRWCSEQDNRIFAFSGHTIVIISVAAVLLAVTMGAIESLSSHIPAQDTFSAASPRGGGGSSEPIVNTQNHMVSNPQTSCAFQTFATSECPQR